MESDNKKISVKKIHRKKFFASLGTGFLGFVLFNSFPFKFFVDKKMKNEDQVTIQINPLAVRRNKQDGKNV